LLNDAIGAMAKLEAKIRCDEQASPSASGSQLELPLEELLCARAKIEEAREWFQEQPEAEEVARLWDSLRQARSWNAELEKAKDWLLEQRESLIKERDHLIRSLEEANATIAKMEKTRIWFLDQQTAWAVERTNLERSLRKLPPGDRGT
jgi:hypothetical protein